MSLAVKRVLVNGIVWSAEIRLLVKRSAVQIIRKADRDPVWAQASTWHRLMGIKLRLQDLRRQSAIHAS